MGNCAACCAGRTDPIWDDQPRYGTDAEQAQGRLCGIARRWLLLSGTVSVTDKTPFQTRQENFFSRGENVSHKPSDGLPQQEKAAIEENPEHRRAFDSLTGSSAGLFSVDELWRSFLVSSHARGETLRYTPTKELGEILRSLKTPALSVWETQLEQAIDDLDPEGEGAISFGQVLVAANSYFPPLTLESVRRDCKTCFDTGSKDEHDPIIVMQDYFDLLVAGDWGELPRAHEILKKTGGKPTIVTRKDGCCSTKTTEYWKLERLTDEEAERVCGRALGKRNGVVSPEEIFKVLVLME